VTQPDLPVLYLTGSAIACSPNGALWEAKRSSTSRATEGVAGGRVADQSDPERGRRALIALPRAPDLRRPPSRRRVEHVRTFLTSACGVNVLKKRCALGQDAVTHDGLVCPVQPLALLYMSVNGNEASCVTAPDESTPFLQSRSRPQALVRKVRDVLTRAATGRLNQERVATRSVLVSRVRVGLICDTTSSNPFGLHGLSRNASPPTRATVREQAIAEPLRYRTGRSLVSAADGRLRR